MILERIGFGVVAAVLLWSALRVVTSKNLVHAVLWLAVMLMTTAAAYLMLHAPFLAAIQLMLYTGGVLTLMLFGIMLTRRTEGIEVPIESTGRARAAIVAAGVFGLMATAITQTPNLATAIEAPKVGARELGKLFLTEHLLAFEVLSLLLLAAMVGAIVIARVRDPRENEQPRLQRPRPRPQGDA
jgi:NADH-quinone oxidoreductase subunit J